MGMVVGIVRDAGDGVLCTAYEIRSTTYELSSRMDALWVRVINDW